MRILENEKLAPYTTFKIGGATRFFCKVKDQFDALQAFEFAKEKNLPALVLGGGSNVLISDSGFNGIVLKIENKGIEVIENPTDVLLKVASGEVWDEVVAFAVKNNWWGIENLSHIPGSTGAIAVQNVGAYGQESSEVIESVTVFDKNTHAILNFKAKDCGFNYRQSIFNTTAKGQYIIFDITLRLKKEGRPNLSYRDLNLRFADVNPLLAEIRQAVIEIRDKKFPFPTEAKKGNAGSFFKNPVLSGAEFADLRDRIVKRFSSEVAVELAKKKFDDKGQTKVPAAFLIELCGLKDLQNGGAGINHSQPLVIVNQSGTATADDVLGLANKVKSEVFDKTGITLKFEPELIGF